jgi:hypothetical protein
MEIIRRMERIRQVFVLIQLRNLCTTTLEIIISRNLIFEIRKHKYINYLIQFRFSFDSVLIHGISEITLFNFQNSANYFNFDKCFKFRIELETFAILSWDVKK